MDRASYRIEYTDRDGVLHTPWTAEGDSPEDALHRGAPDATMRYRIRALRMSRRTGVCRYSKPHLLILTDGRERCRVVREDGVQ